MDHKKILQKANEAVSKGDHETFLSYCTEDIQWIFVGDKTLKGKEAIRLYMKETYKQPPKFDIENMIAQDDYLTSIGSISLLNENDEWIEYDYCDVWKFKDGKMASLKAFVIEK
ncbi:nuclear transport factor 2 family protein [Chryseobacterium sp. MMS23-Vi53]|uniref:nuclear transport factor 2 family protein n=1 Tax=Chryseobacterium sp. MMS23-Vi53 TaxID=3386644 RepID=UPI0039E8AD96